MRQFLLFLFIVSSRRIYALTTLGRRKYLLSGHTGVVRTTFAWSFYLSLSVFESCRLDMVAASDVSEHSTVCNARSFAVPI